MHTYMESILRTLAWTYQLNIYIDVIKGGQNLETERYQKMFQTNYGNRVMESW